MAHSRRRSSVARQQARQLLKDLEIERVPVPLEKVAKHFNARIRYSPLDMELSGMVFITAGVPIIGVNALHPPNRQRFTIAHEIAHLAMHRPLIEMSVHVDKQFPMLKRDETAAEGTDPNEIAANAYAAELLMPQDVVEVEVGSRLIDMEDDRFVEQLAKKFRVSSHAMLNQLNWMYGE